MLLEIGVPALYALVAFFTARFIYKAWRPYKVPLSCTTDRQQEIAIYGESRHRHRAACYKQPGGSGSDGEARLNGLFIGILWPLALGILIIVGGIQLLFLHRELPEEKEFRAAEKTRALEIENEKLRQDQDPAT